MKRFNIQNIVFGLLVVVSLSSYIYLAFAPVEGCEGTAKCTAKQKGGIEAQESAIYAPNILLVRKILEIGAKSTLIHP